MSVNTPTPDLLLVVGIDASGKSTLLDGVSSAWGYQQLEPTTSDEARAFKAATIDTPIDSTLIDERERLYLELNEVFDSVIAERLSEGGKIATTGNALVTKLSHTVMQQVIGEQEDNSAHISVVRSWIDDESLKPDAIALTHAPFSTIRERIQERQDGGANLERFWGFNSLTFLNRYQDSWCDALGVLAVESDVVCVSYDTKKLSPREILDEFISVTSN